MQVIRVEYSTGDISRALGPGNLCEADKIIRNDLERPGYMVETMFRRLWPEDIVKVKEG